MSRVRILREVRDVVILVALGFGMTFAGISCRNCQGDTKKMLVIGSFTAVLWILLWKGNELLGNLISTRISWVRYPLKRFVIGFVATVLYTLIAMWSLTALYEKSFRFEIGAGVLISVVITLVISLFMHAREFLLNWRETSVRAAQYQRESLQAKYASLKNQVNPHFLFNSLNALSNLIYEDPDKADAFIHELSEVYRYVIDTQDSATVSLNDELKFLDSYLFLQRIRFGDKLRISQNLEADGLHVPPLAIQMLIENAIKHNVVSEDDPLTISLRREGDWLVVENNLQKKQSIGDESAGVGLTNIKRRYEMLGAPSVEVEETPDVFRVRVPVLSNDMS